VTVGLAEHPSYVARFPRTVVVAMLLSGPASVAVIWPLADLGVPTRHQGGVLGLLVATPALVTTGIGPAGTRPNEPRPRRGADGLGLAADGAIPSSCGGMRP
jgi:hypothetical protein